MTTVIVLFNLKDDADVAAYEQWALTTDLPTVRGLNHCSGFDLYRGSGMLGSDAPPAYQYIEIIHLDDLAGFREECATDTMKKVAGEFQAFADKPQFIVTERLSS